MMWGKYQPLRAPDGVAASGSGGTGDGGAAASGASAGAGAAAAAATAPWYGDKVDATMIGLWQNKGIDPKDPIAVATRLTEFYRNAEGKLGAPPEEMIRIPKTNAAAADISAYWQRIGVPAEAKDYDLSTVKLADGTDLDSGFVEMVRGALHDGRVPKDRAAGIVTRLVKHMETESAAKLAEKTAIVKTEREALDRNWGTNKTYNEAIAFRALSELGKAAGLTAEQTKQGWDALSIVGGIGASYAMEMLRTFGARMGEAPFVAAAPGQGANNALMSKAQALAEIESLKKDKGFYKQLITDRSVEAKRRWDDLHKIAHAA